jgi:hypothetical protein
MDSFELKKIVDTIIEKEDTDLKAIAIAIGRSRSNLSTLLNSKGRKEVSQKMLNTFKLHYPAYFVIQETEHNKTRANRTGAQVSHNAGPSQKNWDDIVYELRESNAFMREIMRTTLAGISLDTKTAVAYQKAWNENLAEKEAAGDVRKKDKLMLQMGKLVDKYLLGDD